MALLQTSIPSGVATTVVKTTYGRIISATITTTGTGSSSGYVKLVDGYGASDLAVDSVNNKLVTSASHNFVASDVGKYLNVTGGTGFTVGLYYILALGGSNGAILASSPAAVSTGSGVYTVGTNNVLGLVVGNAAIATVINFGQYGVPYSLLYVTGIANSPVFTLVYD